MRSRAWRASLVVPGPARRRHRDRLDRQLGGDDGPSHRTVALAGPQATAIEAKARSQQAAYGIELTTKREPTAAAARQAVRDEDADAALGPAGLVSGKDPDDALVAMLQNAARVVAGEAKLRAPASTRRGPPGARTAAASHRRNRAGEGSGGVGLAYIGALLLYIAILTFGYSIASSVVAEKSRRWSR